MPSKSWDGAVQCGATAKFAEDCAAGQNYVWTKKWPDKRPLFLSAQGQTIYGQARPAVSRVGVRLSDGAVLSLRPVAAYGRRWIALAVPDPLSVAEVIAYSASGEIAHSVPFVHDLSGGPEFFSWLPPGDPGPARATRPLSASLVPGEQVYVGPWGTCLLSSDGGYCYGLGQQSFEVLEDFPQRPGTPRVAVISYRPNVAYLLLLMSNGATERVPVVRGAGMVFAAMRITRHPSVVAWVAYGSTGLQVSSGLGPPDASI